MSFHLYCPIDVGKTNKSFDSTHSSISKKPLTLSELFKLIERTLTSECLKSLYCFRVRRNISEDATVEQNIAVHIQVSISGIIPTALQRSFILVAVMIVV